jgi:predicted amidophosphoribosyltransferase
MKPRDPNVCPSCGERVSMFAAGCSICGAELDPHRADRRPPIRGHWLKRVGKQQPIRLRRPRLRS